MQLELKRGDDPEIPAAAAHTPEEIGVFGRAGDQQPAIGGDDIDRSQVVSSQPVFARQPAEAPAERETGDARCRDDTARGRQAKDLRLAVEVSPIDAGLGASRARLGVDMDAAQPGEVDDQPAVAERMASGASIRYGG